MNSNQAQDGPIPGPPPPPVPPYPFEPSMERPMNASMIIGRFVADLARKPAHWIRENIVEPNRGPKYYWYHRKFGKALPVDECFIDDYPCIYEADLEYKRTRMVDKATLELLQERVESCDYWNQTTKGVAGYSENCNDLRKVFREEETNYFIKYGELMANHTVIHAYNKQKHRMIMERRLARKGAEYDEGKQSVSS